MGWGVGGALVGGGGRSGRAGRGAVCAATVSRWPAPLILVQAICSHRVALRPNMYMLPLLRHTR